MLKEGRLKRNRAYHKNKWGHKNGYNSSSDNHIKFRYNNIDSDYRHKYDSHADKSDALLYKKYKNYKGSARNHLRLSQDYPNREKIHSQKVTIRDSKGTGKVYFDTQKKERNKVLKITFKEPEKSKNYLTDKVRYLLISPKIKIL